MRGRLDCDKYIQTKWLQCQTKHHLSMQIPSANHAVIHKFAFMQDTQHTHTHLQHSESLSQHSRFIRCQVHNTIQAAQQTEKADLIVPLTTVYLPQDMKCSRPDAVNIYTEEEWFIAMCCIYENWADWVQGLIRGGGVDWVACHPPLGLECP